MNTINVEEILSKHGERFANLYNNKPEFKVAIKEIVEAAIDLCAEKALLRISAYDKENTTNSCYKPIYNIKDLSEINPDRESILNVKNLIKYET